MRILPSAQGNIVNALENRYSPLFKHAAVPLVQKRLLPLLNCVHSNTGIAPGLKRIALSRRIWYNSRIQLARRRYI